MNTNRIEAKKKITALKEALNNGDNPIDAMEGAFRGWSVLVVSAGPSCKRWKEVYESELIKSSGKLVVACVKQSIELVGEMCDLHFLNIVNLKKYDYSNIVCITLMSSNVSDSLKYKGFDVNFEILDGLGQDGIFLVRTSDYDAFRLSKTGKYRPVGPGIMHESVLYTLVHLGVKRIATIGWDIADSHGANTHFDQKSNSSLDDLYVSRQNIKKILHKLGLWSVFNYFRTAFSLLKYQFGLKVNKRGMFAGEAEMVSASMRRTRQWLLSHSIELDVISDSRWMK